jgi:hypothetical protein
MLGSLRSARVRHGGCRLARSPDVRRRRLGNKEWRKNTTLIPDVDYEPELFRVKHKRAGKVKKIAVVNSRYMLVRSCCFSAWRSIASAIKRSSSRAYGRPLASHIFAYMLIVVNPGMVLTSFR